MESQNAFVCVWGGGVYFDQAQRLRARMDVTTSGSLGLALSGFKCVKRTGETTVVSKMTSAQGKDLTDETMKTTIHDVGDSLIWLIAVLTFPLLPRVVWWKVAERDTFLLCFFFCSRKPVFRV